LNGNISKSIQCMVLLESRHLCTTVILYIGLWTNVNYNLFYPPVLIMYILIYFRI